MMRQRLERIYAFLCLLSLASSVFVFLFFLAGIVMKRESLAAAGASLSVWGIRLAAAATVAGMAYIYASKNHTLTLARTNSSDKDAPREDDTREPQ